MRRILIFIYGFTAKRAPTLLRWLLAGSAAASKAKFVSTGKFFTTFFKSFNEYNKAMKGVQIGTMNAKKFEKWASTKDAFYSFAETAAGVFRKTGAKGWKSARGMSSEQAARVSIGVERAFVVLDKAAKGQKLNALGAAGRATEVGLLAVGSYELVDSLLSSENSEAVSITSNLRNSFIAEYYLMFAKQADALSKNTHPEPGLYYPITHGKSELAQLDAKLICKNLAQLMVKFEVTDPMLGLSAVNQFMLMKEQRQMIAEGNAKPGKIIPDALLYTGADKTKLEEQNKFLDDVKQRLWNIALDSVEGDQKEMEKIREPFIESLIELTAAYALMSFAGSSLVSGEEWKPVDAGEEQSLVSDVLNGLMKTYQLLLGESTQSSNSANEKKESKTISSTQSSSSSTENKSLLKVAGQTFNTQGGNIVGHVQSGTSLTTTTSRVQQIKVALTHMNDAEVASRVKHLSQISANIKEVEATLTRHGISLEVAEALLELAGIDALLSTVKMTRKDFR